jgi:phosphoglucosamine mutase
MKYFGTDGVRGIFGAGITPALCRAVAREIAAKGKKVVIGTDTRAGGAFIADIMADELKTANVSVVFFGVVTTAELSFLTVKERADYGIMVTASHNDYRYNGIKIFGSQGRKLNETEMRELDGALTRQTELAGSPQCDRRWCCYLAEKFRDLRGWQNPPYIIVDAANGAGGGNAGAVFARLGLPFEIMNNSPDGFNINAGCGAVYPRGLLRAVRKHKGVCIGFAFDGDADRCVAVCKRGVLHGDVLISLLAHCGADADPKLRNNSQIVTTKVFNSGAEEYLRAAGVSVIKTDVGDRFVFNAMEKQNINFGGENSGHIIDRRIWDSGDGLVTALLLLSKIRQNPAVLQTRIKIMPSITKNIAIRPDDKCEFENINFGTGVIVRRSGTENILRITVTAKTRFRCHRRMKRIITQLCLPNSQ